MKLALRFILAGAVLVPLALAVAGGTTAAGRLLEARRAAPAGTVARDAAVRRAWQAQAHPAWRTLGAAARLQRLAFLGGRMVRAAAAPAAAADAATASPAPFVGNLTLLQGPSGSAIAVQRQADCSLSFNSGTYTLSLTAPSISVTATTPAIQDHLHAAGGVATQGDVFAHGCTAPTSGLGSRRAYYLGRTNQNLYMSAAVGYDYLANADVLYYGTVDAASQTVHSFNTDSTVTDPTSLTAGDLDGDGLLDIVVLDGASGSVTVWLAHADGTLGTPVRYVTTGTRATGAVLTDVDGDGKLDLVVSGATTSSSGGSLESIAVLRGHGDGTFGAAQAFSITSPTASNGASPYLNTLVAADLRGTGRPDIVGSNGLVLLNDGQGNFTQAPAFAFPPPLGADTYAPFLAAGDFDEDGKPDLVVSTGAAVTIYRGRGDGSFVAGRSYATDDAVGFVTVDDLDGDGHLDLWIGLANGGMYGGDQYGVRTGYALMGRGDGSFAGAPLVPVQYTGHNLVDVNGDGVPDLVGLGADGSLVVGIGDGKGNWTAHAALPSNTFTIGGQSVTVGGNVGAVGSVDSFDVADVNGDGKPDLVFLVTGLLASNSAAAAAAPGLLVALGDGHGGFATPTFIPAPSFQAAPDFDVGLTLANVRLADVNGDGKPDLFYNIDTTSYTTQTRTVGTAVQLGNGDGSFAAPNVIVYRSAVDTGSFGLNTARVQQFVDVNRDGKPDLIIAAETSTLDREVGGYATIVQVALNNGDGTFAAPVTAPGPDVLATSFVLPVPIVLADMDGDGIPDLVVLGGSTGYDIELSVALGNGDGTFRKPAITTFAAQYLGNEQQIAVADFNADGKRDVAVVNPFGAAGVALGAGDGTLVPLGSSGAATFNLTFNLPVGGSVAVADFTGDGQTDLLVGGVLLAATTASASGGGATTPGFALAADSATASVHAGLSTQAHLSVTPDAGFSGTVTFSCSGLPAGASCAFAPASVAVAGSAASATLTITTTASTLARALRDGGGLPAGLAIAGLGVLAVRRRLHAIWLVACLVVLAACNGRSNVDAPATATAGTPMGSYAIVVTAAAGGVTHTVSYTLVID